MGAHSLRTRTASRAGRGGGRAPRRRRSPTVCFRLRTHEQRAPNCTRTRLAMRTDLHSHATRACAPNCTPDVTRRAPLFVTVQRRVPLFVIATPAQSPRTECVSSTRINCTSPTSRAPNCTPAQDAHQTARSVARSVLFDASITKYGPKRCRIEDTLAPTRVRSSPRSLRARGRGVAASHIRTPLM